MNQYHVTVLPVRKTVSVPQNAVLQNILREAGLHPDAPCGGKGTCGKCTVLVDGKAVRSCQYLVDRDITVTVSETAKHHILTAGTSQQIVPDGAHRFVLAFDIGTTTVVAFLMDGRSGNQLADASMLNPQTQYGADVISRIGHAMNGGAGELKDCIRSCLCELTVQVCEKAGILPEQITAAAIVGNTAMHHLLLGIDLISLTVPPYMPKVCSAMTLPAEGILPIAKDGIVRILPNIAGFIGADTVGCMAAADFDQLTKLTLLIDIGTNGEMVLADKDRRIACSTAAGPAFEGAKIFCGMRGAEGAIDKVTAENGAPCCSVIGGGSAKGICGSGLLDAVGVLLELGMISGSGRMEKDSCDPAFWTTADGCDAVRLCDGVVLTQKDVREVQLAKAAIRAGIELLLKQFGKCAEEIETVYLAGAFGNFLRPSSACAIGMIPPVLLDRIVPVGNAAGEGAKMSALSEKEFERAAQLATRTQFLELASLPEFQDCYVDYLSFEEDDEDE